MCGRFTLRTPAQKLVEQFMLPGLDELPPRYNIAPSQMVAAIRRIDGGPRKLSMLKWGLIPSWADDPAIGNRMINARSETAASKPSFRTAMKRRRCLVPADGFYEWKKSGKLKQPYYIGLASREPFAIAGLWETWRRDDERIESVTLLTTDANALLLPLHDRMPVILAPADYDLWLDPSRAEAGDVQPLLRPFPDDQMTLYPVSTLVNSPSHEDPRCIEPIQVEP